MKTTPEYRKDIKVLADTMEKKGITQYQLAKDLGLSRSTVMRWFKFETPMKHQDYLIIKKYLKLSK